MSLINAVRPILGSKTGKVTLDISANPKAEGELVVVARPVVGPVANNASEELKQLCAALATPIKIIGTPDVIEKEFADVIAEQASYRSSWDARAAQLEAQIAAGAKADATKSGGKASGATGEGTLNGESKTDAADTQSAKPEKGTGNSESKSKPFSL